MKKQLCLETAALKGCRLQKEKEGYTVCGERGKMSLTFAPFDEETARAFQQADALVLDLTSRVSACEAIFVRFAEADGHELLKYLTAAYFEAVSWEIVPGTTYEKAILGKVDTSTPEYIAFEKRLYETVLERMGFREQLPRPSGRAQTDHATGKDNCKRGDAR